MREAVVAGRSWRKSSYSGGDNNCVEVGRAGAAIAVRDTKNPRGGALDFSVIAWQAFTESICQPAAPA
jgi:hypothetical protein